MNPGGGRPIGGGPSPYAGPMKTQEKFGANAFFKSQQDFDDAYSNYQKGYEDYNKNTQGGGLTMNPGATIPLGGEGKPMPFTGGYNPGRPMVSPLMGLGGSTQPGPRPAFNNSSILSLGQLQSYGGSQNEPMVPTRGGAMVPLSMSYNFRNRSLFSKGGLAKILEV